MPESDGDDPDPAAVYADMYFRECAAAKQRGMSLDDWFDQSLPARVAAVAVDLLEAAIREDALETERERRMN